MSALDKVMLAAGWGPQPGDSTGQLALSAMTAVREIPVLLAKADSDDNDGDEDDDNEQTGGDSHAGHATFKALLKKDVNPKLAAKMCAKADARVKASAMAESAAVILAGLTGQGGVLELAAGDVSAADRRDLAAKGQALKDGCLPGETLVATRRGPQRIDSILGACELLTDAGWTQAEVLSFGVKPLLAVTLTRGMDRQTIYATAAHRWLTGTGEWLLTSDLVPGVRIPHVEVPAEGVQADRFDVSHCGVTPDAEQAADGAGRMVMVHLEAGDPAPVRPPASRYLGDTSADGTASVLTIDHALEPGLSEPVFALEGGIPPAHPAAVCEFDPGSARRGLFRYAGTAFGAPVLSGRADREAGMRFFGSAEPAGDRSFVGGRLTSPLRGWMLRFLPLLLVVRSAKFFGGRGLSAIGNAAFVHSFNHTQSPMWEVVCVEETSRREEVFCAVVPDLHRFVLANGILTGNSYPIPDKKHLHSAAVLAASGHGDVSAAKALIRKRARELGVDVSTLPGFGGDSDKDKKVAASMVALAAAVPVVPMEHPPFTGTHAHGHRVTAAHDHDHQHFNDNRHDGGPAHRPGSVPRRPAEW